MNTDECQFILIINKTAIGRLGLRWTSCCHCSIPVCGSFFLLTIYVHRKHFVLRIYDSRFFWKWRTTFSEIPISNISSIFACKEFFILNPEKSLNKVRAFRCCAFRTFRSLDWYHIIVLNCCCILLWRFFVFVYYVVVSQYQKNGLEIFKIKQAFIIVFTLNEYTIYLSTYSSNSSVRYKAQSLFERNIEFHLLYVNCNSSV